MWNIFFFTWLRDKFLSYSPSASGLFWRQDYLIRFFSLFLLPMKTPLIHGVLQIYFNLYGRNIFSALSIKSLLLLSLIKKLVEYPVNYLTRLASSWLAYTVVVRINIQQFGQICFHPPILEKDKGSSYIANCHTTFIDTFSIFCSCNWVSAPFVFWRECYDLSHRLCIRFNLEFSIVSPGATRETTSQHLGIPRSPLTATGVGSFHKTCRMTWSLLPPRSFAQRRPRLPCLIPTPFPSWRNTRSSPPTPTVAPTCRGGASRAWGRASALAWAHWFRSCQNWRPRSSQSSSSCSQPWGGSGS